MAKPKKLGGAARDQSDTPPAATLTPKGTNEGKDNVIGAGVKKKLRRTARNPLQQCLSDGSHEHQPINPRALPVPAGRAQLRTRLQHGVKEPGQGCTPGAVDLQEFLAACPDDSTLEKLTGAHRVTIARWRSGQSPVPFAVFQLIKLWRQTNAWTVYLPMPCDKRVNAKNPRWAGFRPDWLRDAEKTARVAPVNFEHLRRHVLFMTLEQCAAFLRVGAASVAAWEAGIEPIPYAAYLALRMAGELQYLPHSVREWADWRIIEAGPDAGKLLDSRTGEMFAPGEIATIRYAYAQASSILAENHRLKQQMKAMQDEVERLRTLRQIDGVTRELEGMQEKIGALLDGLNQGVPPALRAAVPSPREEVLQHETA